MAFAPRRIFGIEGGLRPGDRADITAVDLDSTFTVGREMFLSKGTATPFEGKTLHGRVKLTLSAGKIAYENL
jgi:dihydroorotase